MEYEKTINSEISYDNQNKKYSNHIVQSSLFRGCVNILNTTSNLFTVSNLPKEQFIDIIQGILNLFVDAIDQWLPKFLPNNVEYLSIILSEDTTTKLESIENLQDILNNLESILLEFLSKYGKISPLNELITHVHHTLYRWGTYVSTFTPNNKFTQLESTLLSNQTRIINENLHLKWKDTIRISSIYSFLDRAIYRLNPNFDESLIIKYLSNESNHIFLSSIQNSINDIESNLFLPGGISIISEKIPKLVLQLSITRSQRIMEINSNSKYSLLSQNDSLFSYYQTNGIECERHQQQLRELLKYLLLIGYWELGDYLTKCYMNDYQNALDSDLRKKELKSSKLIIQTNGISDRLTSLVEELDRVSDKFQDRTLHDGEFRPRPVYFVIRFLSSPWKNIDSPINDEYKKFKDFFSTIDSMFVNVKYPESQNDNFKTNFTESLNSLSSIGIGNDELWILVKIDPVIFLDVSFSDNFIDDIEQNGPLSTESRFIKQLESAFPEYVIISSAVLYPYNRYPIDPSIHSTQTTFRPYSSKVIQIFRAYPNISFEADESSIKNLIKQSIIGAEHNNFDRKQRNTTSNPHLRRTSVSSSGGLVDLSRRRRHKQLASTTIDTWKQSNPENNDISIHNEILPLILDQTESQNTHENVSAWEAYSSCDSFLIHTELSDILDEVGKDDCISSITLVIQTSLGNYSQNNQKLTKDGALDSLLKNINSFIPFRLCLVSTVYVFPSFLSHAYSILRQQLRIILHCYELLQHFIHIDHTDSPHNDLCDSSTILKYITSALFSLIMNESQGQRAFGITNSSALISAEGERRNLLWQHKRRDLKRDLMSKRGKENLTENETVDVDMIQMEKDFMTSLDNTEMSYLIKMGLFKSEFEQESLENDTNLFNLVQEMNNGLNVSLQATLILFRKICLKFSQRNLNQGNNNTQTNIHKQDKRIQKKETQENSNEEDVFTSNLLQISIWLENQFHAK